MKRKQENKITEVWIKLFHTWERPSFSAHNFWTIFAVTNYNCDNSPEIIKVKVLHQQHYSEWLENDDNLSNIPEVNNDIVNDNNDIKDYHFECIITLEEFLPLFTELKSTTIPVMVFTNLAGLDGTTYGFNFSDSMSSIKLEWWCDMPKEWRSFTSSVEKMQIFLKNQIEKSKNELSSQEETSNI